MVLLGIFSIIVIFAVVYAKNSTSRDRYSDAVGGAIFASICLLGLYFTVVISTIQNQSSYVIEKTPLAAFEDGAYVHTQYTDQGLFTSFNEKVDGKAVPYSFTDEDREYSLITVDENKPYLVKQNPRLTDFIWVPWIVYGTSEYVVQVAPDQIKQK